VDKGKPSLSWSLRIVGVFMVAASVVGGLLVTFVLPGNNYLSSLMLLMLGLLFMAGLVTLVLGFFITYRRVIGRSIALPAVIVSRLLGRG
jgi:uncharacterized membrane protein